MSTVEGRTSSTGTEDDDNGGISSKTGFLTKRAMSSMDAFANWKQRFFVLADGNLSYYKQGSGIFASSKDDIAHLKGEIELTPDTVVRKSNIDDKINCFEVITPTKKLFAQADTAAEQEEWINAIRSHVNAIRKEATVKLRSRTGTEDAQRSILETDEFYTTASSSDITALKALLQQLVEENRRLKEQLAQKDNEILMLERAEEQQGRIGGGVAKKKASAAVLDLRDVRKKQFQLWDAAEEGDLAATNALLQEAVVDVNGKGIDQWAALHLAVCHNHPAVAQVLIQRGAFVNARTRERLTPLHIACRRGNLACVTVLLGAGAEPSLTDQAGNGALHAAAEGGHIQVVRTLVARGASTDVANASGSLPVHLAPIGHPIRVLLSNSDGKAGASDELAQKLSLQHDSDKSTSTGPPSRESIEVNAAFRNKYQEEMALSPRDFEFIRVLGRGAFAKVYLVRGKGSNKDKFYALKAYNKQAIMQKNQARYILTEKAALQACSDHPFIVTLHFSFQTKDRLFFVMDYCGGGDLLSVLTRKKSFTEDEAAFYIAQIVLALSHLHAKNIVFRDLKPENVVMDLDGNCLLTDFGISKEGVASHTTANTFCGSPMYLAPEMLSRSGHGFSLDWYSVGALLYELLTGLPPYYTNDKKQLFQNILQGDLPIPDYISPPAKSVLLGLLNRDPSVRLGSGKDGDKEIMTHPFFRKIDWQALYEKKLKPPIRPTIQQTADGIPDISNFPQAFTDQVISDAECGLDNPYASNDPRQQMLENAELKEKDRKLFQDFDFQPPVTLSPEARAFEKLAVQETTL